MAPLMALAAATAGLARTIGGGLDGPLRNLPQEWQFEPRGSRRAAGEESHEARPERQFEPRAVGRAVRQARREARPE